MVSSPTTRNRLNKQGTGDNTNTWGSKLNAEVFDLLDMALDGVAAVTVSGPVTLTSQNYADDQARRRVLKLTGAGGALVTIPSVEKNYLVYNGCAAAITVGPAGGSVATVPAGEMQWVFCDGANCFSLPWIGKAGGALTGFLTLHADPASAMQAATKQYVDGVAMGSISVSFQWADVLNKPDAVTALGALTPAANKFAFYTGANSAALSDVTAYGLKAVAWNEVTTSGNVNPCVVRTRYLIDSATGARTLTLPAAPADGDEIVFIDKDGAAKTNKATLARNGNKIAGFTDNLILDANYAAVRLRYRTATTNWEFLAL